MIFPSRAFFTACRFAGKALPFRLALAGWRHAAALRSAFFKGKTPQRDVGDSATCRPAAYSGGTGEANGSAVSVTRGAFFSHFQLRSFAIGRIL